MKSIAKLTLISILASPLAFAYSEDFVVTNNTDTYGSASLLHSPCSSNIGSSGVLKPHEVHTFSHTLIRLFCGSSCTVYLYPNDHCGGSPMGSAKIDDKLGVVSYTNNDEEHFRVSGSGFNFTIDNAGSWIKNWLKRFI